MSKRVFIIHGWGGNSKEGWFPWLKRELEKRSFEVIVPELPETETPRIYNWIPFLEQTVKDPDQNTYFVGHSLGCQAIARYLETLPRDTKVGGAVFVAGFFKRLTGLGNDPKIIELFEEWLKTPLDLKILKKHLNKSIAIFSDNDHYVPLDNQNDFKNMLGSEIILEKNMGHFSGSQGCFELPIALKSILKITN